MANKGVRNRFRGIRYYWFLTPMTFHRDGMVDESVPVGGCVLMSHRLVSAFKDATVTDRDSENVAVTVPVTSLQGLALIDRGSLPV